MSLYNIGLGAAKSISIKWIYSEMEVKPFILDVYDSTMYYHKVEYLVFLPANKEVKIYLPYYYLKVCGQLLNEDILGMELTNSRETNLILEVNFEDIYLNTNSNQYSAKFQCIGSFISTKFFQKKLIEWSCDPNCMRFLPK